MIDPQTRMLDRAFLDFRSKGVAAKAAAQATARQFGVSEAEVLYAYEVCQGQRVRDAEEPMKLSRLARSTRVRDAYRAGLLSERQAERHAANIARGAIVLKSDRVLRFITRPKVVA